MPGRGAAEEDRWSRADLVALLIAVALIAASMVVGQVLLAAGYAIQVPFPPLLATWAPHVGWGTPLVLVCVVAALGLQVRCATLGWRRLLLVGWLLALAWMVSLVLVDGLDQGVVAVMASEHEYLAELGRVGDPLTFLRGFTDGIVDRPGAWTTHVSAHPPLITLWFWGLQQVGLGGPLWAGASCIAISSAVVVAVPVTVRELGAEAAARRAIPLLAVFPGAVWMGVSADGIFAGVATAGLALVVVGAVRRRPGPAVLGGIGLGAAVYLSYGSLLVGVVAVTALAITVRRHGPRVLAFWAAAVGGALAVAGVHGLLGFHWFAALEQLHLRYYQGVAARRPYGYFVWANLGAWLIASSVMLAVGVRRAVASVARQRWNPVALLCLAGLAAAVIADLTGLTKAETERIWLTFGAYAWLGVAMLRGRMARWALVIAAGTAITVNHLLITGW